MDHPFFPLLSQSCIPLLPPPGPDSVCSFPPSGKLSFFGLSPCASGTSAVPPLLEYVCSSQEHKKSIIIIIPRHPPPPSADGEDVLLIWDPSDPLLQSKDCCPIRNGDK